MRERNKDSELCTQPSQLPPIASADSQQIESAKEQIITYFGMNEAQLEQTTRWGAGEEKKNRIQGFILEHPYYMLKQCGAECRLVLVMF